MKTISGYVLTNVLGWKIIGEFPNIKKAVIIYAPHTSVTDAIYGKLYFNEQSVNYKFLSKKTLFWFPLNIIMSIFGSISVNSSDNKNTIFEITKMFNQSDEFFIVLSPEGTRACVSKWNKGFYYMALKANVPIIVGYLDYEKKEIGIKDIIENPKNISDTMQILNFLYKNVAAKHPEQFSLDEIN